MGVTDLEGIAFGHYAFSTAQLVQFTERVARECMESCTLQSDADDIARKFGVRSLQQRLTDAKA